MRIRRMIVRALGAGLLLWGGTAYGQSGTCTEITSVPITITTSGVHCLTGNLTYALTTGVAITVNTSGVVIDFNGYRLYYSGAPGYNVTAVEVTNSRNVTIRNGSISGEFAYGINSTGRATIVEDMRLSDMVAGITTYDEGAIIRRNYSHRVFTSILVYGYNSRVIDNDITGFVGDNAGNGILIHGPHGLVVGNRLTHVGNGIHYNFSGTGKYRGNLTADVTNPFSGGTDAGNNN